MSGLEFGQRFRAFHHLASCLASASSPGSGISPSVACNGMDLLVLLNFHSGFKDASNCQSSYSLHSLLLGKSACFRDIA